MIIPVNPSKYETADGSADARKEAAPRVRRTNEPTAPMTAPYQVKPVWSMQSLRDLNAAIEQSRRADDPWNVHQQAQRIARDEAQAAQTREALAEAAARALRDRFSNPWEHSR